MKKKHTNTKHLHTNPKSEIVYSIFHTMEAHGQDIQFSIRTPIDISSEGGEFEVPLHEVAKALGVSEEEFEAETNDGAVNQVCWLDENSGIMHGVLSICGKFANVTMSVIHHK